MFKIRGHGNSVVPDIEVQNPKYKGHQCLSEVCGLAPSDPPPNLDSDTGTFSYLFPRAENAEGGAAITKALDDLAEAMVDLAPSEHENSNIPPVFTYLGQFIDHDITAGTDREAGVSVISDKVIEPLHRADVINGLGNLRAGALNLDSLYGDGPLQGSFLKKFQKLLRFPSNPAKMWIGTMHMISDRVALPKDIAGDLLRLGHVIQKGLDGFSEQDFLNLPNPIRDMFVDENGIKTKAAVIGDDRNDENLFVAQLHLAFLRFHNRIVDIAHKHGGPVDDSEALYEWARQQVRWHYQWLIINEYLPTVCDKSIVQQVLKNKAPVYKKFLANNPPSKPDLLPMPLEFSVAGFRFGHSMVRASYDWNEFFNPDEKPADFNLLFLFTGGSKNPLAGAPKLPSSWPAGWDRLAKPVTSKHPNRSTRKIDTFVSLPLKSLNTSIDGDDTMSEEEIDRLNQLFKHLMRRNLRRGLKLNIPSAQECIHTLENEHGIKIKPLTQAQLKSGPTGKAVDAGDFHKNTPLWFYVLKEAECAGGNNLGQLGSLIVADTLVGLVMADKSSYWHQKGSDNGKWHPKDGAQPAGEPVTSIEAMLRAALVLK